MTAEPSRPGRPTRPAAYRTVRGRSDGSGGSAGAAVDRGDHLLDDVLGGDPVLGDRDEQRIQVGVAEFAGEDEQRMVVGQAPVALAQGEPERGPADAYLVADRGRLTRVEPLADLQPGVGGTDELQPVAGRAGGRRVAT